MSTDPLSSSSASSDPLTDHAYDGIQEYDNPLPGWWKWFFVISIIFSVFYWVFFHFGASGRTMFDLLSADEAALAQKQYGTLGTLAQDRATLVRFMKDNDWVSYGKSIYRTNCQSCHGPDGGGLVGLNLCDSKWKNVKHIEDIMKVINNGANNNAMPAWKQRFSDPRDVIMVSAYVATLLGTKPANPKSDDVSRIEIASWDADIAELPADAISPKSDKAADKPAGKAADKK
ncbi:MAG: c-type cytochrome [Pirellulaceae bacterium]|nr:c-type cytochrome [Pirellulaceae bacterium]